MKYIKTFEEFSDNKKAPGAHDETAQDSPAGKISSAEPDTITEATMTLNDFSIGFSDFYEFVNKYKHNMDKDTRYLLKEAFKHLDSAWETECNAHGEDYEQVKVKL